MFHQATFWEDYVITSVCVYWTLVLAAGDWRKALYLRVERVRDIWLFHLREHRQTRLRSLSNPAFRPHTVDAEVGTLQVVPTILRALGLDPQALDGVR
jgi:hypothetical protein